MAKWIQKAIKRPGALRKKAQAAGLAKKGKPLSRSALSKLKARAKKQGDTRTVRQVNLAQTLKKMSRRSR